MAARVEGVAVPAGIEDHDFQRCERRGGVAVPAHLARPLLRVLVRALAREAREDGGVVPPGIGAFLRALQDATTPMADVGPPEPPPASVDPVMATVTQVAEQTGYSPRQLRRLAAAGRIRARRIHTRGWLIDPDSLATYRQGGSC
ncbi:helix-turn-helix domain-containing protein [Nonomuraea sp. NPDC055795]